jgi:SAM-dependent methyltransferase
MLAILRRKGRGAGVAADAAALPFRDNEFDGVYCVALLHHLVAPSLVSAALREMLRVTRPGGRVVVWDANRLNPYWRSLLGRFPQDTGRERIVPAGEVVRGLRGAGAVELQVLHSGLVPDFAPRALMPLFRTMERVAEAVPVLRLFTAHIVVVARKA